jgi:predicted RNase H-like nuclease
VQRASGPRLPYVVIAGVVPVGGGWLVASAKLQGVTLAIEYPRVLDSFVAVVDEKPTFSVIALHAWVGWLDHPDVGGRGCDRAARELVGPANGQAVRPAMTRSALEATGGADPDTATDTATPTLLPQYREVFSEMAPYRQRMILEVHPELTFYELNGDRALGPIDGGEEDPGAGMRERRALLEGKIADIDRIIDDVDTGASPSELLGAAACLWTARRIFARAVVRLPADPEWDSQGLKMELVR